MQVQMLESGPSEVCSWLAGEGDGRLGENVTHRHHSPTHLRSFGL